MSEPKRIQKPWTVISKFINEVVHGTISEALETAVSILLIESGWPKKGNVVTSAKISREDVEFTLTLETPDKQKL